MLRELQDNGFIIREFYDELSEENNQLAQFEKLTIQEILNRIEFKSIQLRTKYDVKYVRNEMRAGEGTEELLSEFEETLLLGHFVFYLTTLFRGWCLGHLIMKSAPSSTGKSRMAVADLCNVSVDQILNDEQEDFIINPNYQGSDYLFILELDTRKEINPMFLACIYPEFTRSYALPIFSTI